MILLKHLVQKPALHVMRQPALGIHVALRRRTQLQQMMKKEATRTGSQLFERMSGEHQSLVCKRIVPTSQIGHPAIVLGEPSRSARGVGKRALSAVGKESA